VSTGSSKKEIISPKMLSSLLTPEVVMTADPQVRQSRHSISSLAVSPK
jgi:hypothetical protein